MGSISQPGLIALTWTFTGVGLILTAGRYIIRKRLMGGLAWDDLAHGFAVVTLLGYVATYTAAFPVVDEVGSWQAAPENLKTEPPSNSELIQYFRYMVTVSVLFWVCIYSIKLSFLLLYRKLFGVSQRFTRVWWIVVIYTLITFLACVLATLWTCITPGRLFVAGACITSTASATSAKYVKMWCVLNVTSDLFIMLLPLWMLRNLQMQTAQKLGLAFLFLLTMIDILFDILRTVNIVHGNAIVVNSTIWNILEATVAVIISCLPSYRALFRHSRPGPVAPYNALESDTKAITTRAAQKSYKLKSYSVGLEQGSPASSLQ